MYLLLGAPNNKSFLPQVMVKLVFALSRVSRKGMTACGDR
jgi:hypothetical protein